MIRRISMTVFALLMVVPLAAQAPAGWDMRLDNSTNAADPDDVPEVTFPEVSDGFRVDTGPAVTLWDPDNTATGAYTLKGTFTLHEPSGHANYYGLVYGGGGLDGPRQNYLYFLVAQNGTFLVKHRAGDETTHDVQPRTEHAAVAMPGENGHSTNVLEVRVGADQTEFVVNGTVVHTAPQSGMAARTDGIWGVRVNHVIPGVQVTDLGVTN
jgi:hypothetical protein